MNTQTQQANPPLTVYVIKFDSGEEEYITASSPYEAEAYVWEVIDDPMGIMSIAETIDSKQTEEEFYS